MIIRSKEILKNGEQTKADQLKKNLNNQNMSKPTLGIIGGGQLGSMLATAAKKLNIKTVVFCDDIDAPAQKFSNEFIFGSYADQDKIMELVSKVDVITYEFENIPFQTLNEINKIKPVLPKPSVNRIIQHRLAEKDFINKLNIRTTQYVSIESKSEIESAQELLPGLLKTTTLGYDGKGQYLINNIEEIDEINIDFSKGYILEKLVKLKKEISIIITRFNDKKYEIYEPIENVHEDQILKYSTIPAVINEKILEQSKKWATQIAEELKYVGTLCVEFFIDRNDNLYVNEVAPRVHNSGHLTINAYNISQFENHVRAVCKLDQIHLKKISNAKMINLIGDQITVYRNKDFKKNEFFFDYLKKEIKPKRKMGHLTTLII
jgi:5-(carboxyamino)imidazole ribonucleotide synthase